MAKPANLFQPASFTRATNSTAEIVMASVTVPAFFLRSPYKLAIDWSLKLPSTNGSDTFLTKVKVGSHVVATVAAHDVVNNEVIGGSVGGSIANDLLQARSLSAGSAVLPTGLHLADLALDTNADVVIALTGQFNAASASNQADAKEFIVSLQPLD
jgi:hypothetical protein